MKICKNDFDIILQPLRSCTICGFTRKGRSCFWVTLFKEYRWTCGGMVQDTISDIFKL